MTAPRPTQLNNNYSLIAMKQYIYLSSDAGISKECLVTCICVSKTRTSAKITKLSRSGCRRKALLLSRDGGLVPAESASAHPEVGVL